MTSSVKSLNDVIARLDAIGANPTKRGRDQYLARCPLHDDNRPSMTVSKGQSQPVVAWCFACSDRFNSQSWFSNLMARLDQDEQMPLPAKGQSGKGNGSSNSAGTPVATYLYTRNGKLIAKKVRYEQEDSSKSFAWFRPYGTSWAQGLGAGMSQQQLPLYRGRSGQPLDASDVLDTLDALPVGTTIYIVEGEKDADRAAREGLIAISSGGGANGPLPNDVSALTGQHVVIVADNDPAGHKHAMDWKARLVGVTPHVRIALPNVDSVKADLSDHLDQGFTVEELRFVNGETDLQSVLDRVRSWLTRYIKMRSDWGLTVLTLWIAHTHAMDAWYATPRILLTSALPGCGKTTALEHIEHLTFNAMMGSNATPALLARVTQSGPRPLLLDETDNLLDRKKDGTGDLVSMLNSGYKKSGMRTVLVPQKGSDWVSVQMPTYAPVAFAGIGDHLPDATSSRTIVLHLDRAKAAEIEDSDWQFIEEEAYRLRDQMAVSISSKMESLSIARPQLPVNGRTAEIWRPLVALADAAGESWSTAARAALTHFQREAEIDREAGLAREKPSQRLLSDLQEIWPDGESFVGTEILIERLSWHNPENWGVEARFGMLKAKRLAWMLKEYGIRPTKSSDGRARGYLQKDLMGAWETYIPHTVDPSEASDPSNPSGPMDVHLDYVLDSLGGVVIEGEPAASTHNDGLSRELTSLAHGGRRV